MCRNSGSRLSAIEYCTRSSTPPVLQKYSPVLTSTQGGSARNPCNGDVVDGPRVPKHWQWPFRNAKGLTEADPWPNLVSRVAGKRFLHKARLPDYWRFFANNAGVHFLRLPGDH